MIQDPFTDNGDIRLLCDILSPDTRDCRCGHGIQDHAEWNSIVGACEVCDACVGYSED